MSKTKKVQVMQTTVYEYEVSVDTEINFEVGGSLMSNGTPVNEFIGDTIVLKDDTKVISGKTEDFGLQEVQWGLLSVLYSMFL